VSTEIQKVVPGENSMRSDLVFGAFAHISNRYQLCGLVSKGARKLHTPKTRLQDTTNNVLAHLRQLSPVAQVALESAHFQGRVSA
jgi:hypothetical protein